MHNFSLLQRFRTGADLTAFDRTKLLPPTDSDDEENFDSANAHQAPFAGAYLMLEGERKQLEA